MRRCPPLQVPLAELRRDEKPVSLNSTVRTFRSFDPRSHAAVAATKFKAIAAESINIKVITTSEIKISVLIDRKYMELAVQALHDTFGLEKAT